MLAFHVSDMTCGHCVSIITKALKAIDKDAKVTVDLGQHLVMVEPTEADAQEISDAISEAGYTPMPRESATVVAEPVKVVEGDCCGSPV
jgi:copper chaperone